MATLLYLIVLLSEEIRLKGIVANYCCLNVSPEKLNRRKKKWPVEHMELHMCLYFIFTCFIFVWHLVTIIPCALI